jgi:hypothetical protein
MTNGETLFVVAFTMVLLLGPFALMIYSLLKHSKETYSVLYTPQIFKTSAFEYFFSFDIFFGSFWAIMGMLTLSSMIGIKISVTEVPHWCVYVTIYCTILMMFVGSAYISINYWKYSKNLIIAFYPETKRITINTNSQEYSIHEGDIENVKIYTNDNNKLFFAYYRLKLKNGEEFILTCKTKGVFGIFEFFKKISSVKYIKRFPIIR